MIGNYMAEPELVVGKPADGLVLMQYRLRPAKNVKGVGLEQRRGRKRCLLTVIALLAVNMYPKEPTASPKPEKEGLSACARGEPLIAFAS